MKRPVAFRDILRAAVPAAVHRLCLWSGMWLFLILWTVADLASMIVTGRNAWAAGRDQFYFWASGFSCLLCLPVLLYLRRRAAWRRPKGRYTRSGAWTFLYIPVLGALAAMGMNNLISLSAIDRLFTGFREAAQDLYSANLWAELAVLGLLIPIVEELVYRELTYERLKEFLRPGAAAFWCSLAFGVLHGNVTQGLYAFVLSFGMIYVKEKYQTVAAPVLFHMGANIYSVLVTETGLFQWMVSSWEMFLAATVLALALCFLLFWRISEDAWAERVHV